MKNTNPENGESCAFPYVIPETDASFEVEPGLSKRELFAALALAGLMAAKGEINSAMVRDAAVAAELLIAQLDETEISQ